MRGNRRRAASRAAGCCPGRSRPASDCRDLRARPVADLPPPRRPRPGHRRLRRCRRNRQGCSRSRSPVPRLKRLPRSVAAAGVTGVRGAATSFLTPRPSTAATYQTTAEPLHFCRASPEELSISAEPRDAVARIRRVRLRWGISIACPAAALLTGTAQHSTSSGRRTTATPAGQFSRWWPPRTSLPRCPVPRCPVPPRPCTVPRVPPGSRKYRAVGRCPGGSRKARRPAAGRLVVLC